MTDLATEDAEATILVGTGMSAASSGGHRRVKAPRHLRLIAVVVVLAGALTYLLVEGLGSSLDYFETVPQALSDRATLGTGQFRLEGTVVAGTVQRTARGADFTLEGGGREIAVENVGSPPELFQTGIPVVVTGHFASKTMAIFLSDQIMVKHSASYVAAHPTRVKAANGSSR